MQRAEGHPRFEDTANRESEKRYGRQFSSGDSLKDYATLQANPKLKSQGETHVRNCRVLLS
jgi:hypothetical protein